MKRFSILFILIMLSCSKRTHIAESNQTSLHIKGKSDSTGIQAVQSVDRSVTTTNVDLDTSILIHSNFLAADYNIADSVKHFENNDFSIDFKNQHGSLVNFKISPKDKWVNVRYHRKTVIQNDIAQTKNSRIKYKKSTDSKQDSVYKQNTDLRQPVSGINKLQSVGIWLIVILIIGVAAFAILRKFI